MTIFDMKSKFAFSGEDGELVNAKLFLDSKLKNYDKFNNLDELYSFCFEKNEDSTKRYLYAKTLMRNKEPKLGKIFIWLIVFFQTVCVSSIMFFFTKNIAIWNLIGLNLLTPLIGEMLYRIPSKIESNNIFDLKKSTLKHTLETMEIKKQEIKHVKEKSNSEECVLEDTENLTLQENIYSKSVNDLEDFHKEMTRSLTLTKGKH